VQEGATGLSGLGRESSRVEGAGHHKGLFHALGRNKKRSVGWSLSMTGLDGFERCVKQIVERAMQAVNDRIATQAEQTISDGSTGGIQK